MTNDQYVYGVIANHSPALTLQQGHNILETFRPTLNGWAGAYLMSLSIAGSLAKGTAIAGTSDIDILISLRHNTPQPLQEIHSNLHNWMLNQNLGAVSQNVAVGVTYNGYKIDLVPARLQSLLSSDHSIWLSKRNTWQQTNVQNHVNHVLGTGLQNEIKAIKIWRKKHNLSFSSFPLELTVIRALNANYTTSISANVITVWRFIANNMNTVRLVDPSNTNNFLDDELKNQEKQALVNAANRALNSTWAEAIG